MCLSVRANSVTGTPITRGRLLWKPPEALGTTVEGLAVNI